LTTPNLFANYQTDVQTWGAHLTISS